jgi:hypothetical protein
MTPESEKLLMVEFPFLRTSGDPKQDLMCFGFECGDGWLMLLHTLFRAITVLTDVPEDFQVVQVKEKFGTLRVYANGATDEILTLIDMAEDASGRICEMCGKEGTTSVDGGWVYTNCEQCKANRLKQKGDIYGTEKHR